MAWRNGSIIFSELIDVVQNVVKDDDARALIYNKMLEVFVDEDCDTLDECLGIDTIFDECYVEFFPGIDLGDVEDEDDIGRIDD